MDFLADDSYHPWLMEVNATPSMKVSGRLVFRSRSQSLWSPMLRLSSLLQDILNAIGPQPSSPISAVFSKPLPLCLLPPPRAPQVAHEDPATLEVINDAKWPVVWDMFNMLQVGPERFSQVGGGRPRLASCNAAPALNPACDNNDPDRLPPQPIQPTPVAPPPPPLSSRNRQEPSGHEASISEVEAELALRGGFVPLMHLFPREEGHPGLSIPWTPADDRLREWAAGSEAYQAAAAPAGW
jgi:hypothetical protein